MENAVKGPTLVMQRNAQAKDKSYGNVIFKSFTCIFIFSNDLFFHRIAEINSLIGVSLNFFVLIGYFFYKVTFISGTGSESESSLNNKNK